MADKVRENKLRRAAERQGKTLSKTRRRDPRAIDFETWRLNDSGGLSIDQVSDMLGHWDGH